MLPGKPNTMPESDVVPGFGLNCKETQLTLGLPGAAPKSGLKRAFPETVDLHLGSGSASSSTVDSLDQSGNETSTATKPPAPYCGQVVGWPPVRAFRKSMKATKSSGKYVKVAADGAPYLRKVDLEMYTSYQHLLSSLEDMFTCLTIPNNNKCNVLKQRKLVDSGNRTEYVPTYEDKDGDWMLVGDVPWKMFVESCKRLRMMRSSEPEMD